MSASVISDQEIVDAYQVRCGLTFVPTKMQHDMYRRIVSADPYGCAVLLKAPTGSGKTEAVVVPAVEARRRLFLIYPARSLLQDQEMRIAEILKYRSRCAQLNQTSPVPPYSLVVDTGAERYRRAWQLGEEVPQQPSTDDQQGDQALIERRERRHLLYGDVILTTLDKLLYRFFGFGEERKGYIYPLRLRYGRRPLFCFDEAHSYEDVAFGNFVDLVRAIGFNAQAPRDVIVMTATMPKTYEDQLTPMLDCLDCLDSAAPPPVRAFTWREAPSNYGRDEQKRTEFLRAVMDVVREHHATGRRTIVALERVRDAIEIYKQLCPSWPDAVLYHGRQPHEMRRTMYERLKPRGADGKPMEIESYLLVTTAAIEVGCDLDAHTLITEVCNPNQLIQRAGRCNRKGERADAQIIVVGARELLEDRRSLPQSQIPQYFGMLAQMDSRDFTARTLLELGHRPQINDYRVRTMFAMLYEYVYEAERANKPLHDKGLVTTRSWEPTVTLATAWEEGKSPENALEIGIRSCIAFGAGQPTEGCQVYVRQYDDRNQQWTRSEPTYGGSAYQADIVIIVPREGYFDKALGYYEVPKVFVGTRGNGYERRVIYQRPSITEPDSDSQTREVKRVVWRYLDELSRAEDGAREGEEALEGTTVNAGDGADAAKDEEDDEGEGTTDE